MCNCGCNKCETKKPSLMINESVAPREILSEGLKYHIDNNKPLTEQVYRAGSKSYFNLWAEARALYSRGIIEVEGDDKEILTETSLGHFGVLEDGTKVPLDFPMLCEGERFKLEDLTFDQVKSSFPDAYTKPSTSEYGTFFDSYDSIKFPNPDDSLTVINGANMFDSWKAQTLEKYGNVDIEFDPNAVWSRKVKIIDDKFSKEKETFIRGKQAFLDREREQGRSGLDEIVNKIYNNIRESLTEAKKISDDKLMDLIPKLPKDYIGKNTGRGEYTITTPSGDSIVLTRSKDKKNWSYEPSKETLKVLGESKKSNKKLNKPMRDSSGGKAYKVYVKDPKTGNIKTVRFGSGGLKAKINDKKARTAFAKRHKCAQKKDKTKASYWSCRLPRYAKLLGLKSSFSGFW